MATRYIEVVAFNHEALDDATDEDLAVATMPLVGHLHSDKQFGDSYRGNSCIIFIVDDAIDIGAISFCVDEDRRIEDQSPQDRS